MPHRATASNISGKSVTQSIRITLAPKTLPVKLPIYGHPTCLNIDIPNKIRHQRYEAFLNTGTDPEDFMGSVREHLGDITQYLALRIDHRESEEINKVKLSWFRGRQLTPVNRNRQTLEPERRIAIRTAFETSHSMRAMRPEFSHLYYLPFSSGKILPNLPLSELCKPAGVFGVQLDLDPALDAERCQDSA
jgi:hypothetical protein